MTSSTLLSAFAEDVRHYLQLTRRPLQMVGDFRRKTIAVGGSDGQIALTQRKVA